MRRGFDGLSRQVQEVLGYDPFSGHLFVFRGRNTSRKVRLDIKSFCSVMYQTDD